MNLLKKIFSVRFLKFAFVGGLNTLVDLVVLNALFFTFGLREDAFWYLVFKTLAFIAAVTNSYFFNKFWVFKSTQSQTVDQVKQSSLFLLVSGIGLIINAGVSLIVFKLIGNLGFNVHSLIAVNVGALAGTAAVMLSNFFGYSYLVFKKQ